MGYTHKINKRANKHQRQLIQNCSPHLRWQSGCAQLLPAWCVLLLKVLTFHCKQDRLLLVQVCVSVTFWLVGDIICLGFYSMISV